MLSFEPLTLLVVMPSGNYEPEPAEDLATIFNSFQRRSYIYNLDFLCSIHIQIPYAILLLITLKLGR